MTSADRRRQPRLGQACLDGLSGRVRPGHVVRVMDLSAGGALIETSRRLAPGGIADMHLESGELRHDTRVRVVRSYVSHVLPDAITFRCAVALEKEVPWLSALSQEPEMHGRSAPGLERG